MRSSIESPHRFLAEIVALALVTCIACTGCTTLFPAGRLVGPQSIGVFADGHEGCDGCQHHRGAACQACDESVWPVDGGADWHDEWYASGEGDEFAPLPLDAYDEGACGSTCDDGSGRCSRRRWYEPEAGIFNFCVPPAAIGAHAPPPPGRFHPVPTRPVFAPRPSLALVAPVAE